jgi:hypothetical protein
MARIPLDESKYGFAVAPLYNFNALADRAGNLWLYFFNCGGCAVFLNITSYLYRELDCVDMLADYIPCCVIGTGASPYGLIALLCVAILERTYNMIIRINRL